MHRIPVLLWCLCSTPLIAAEAVDLLGAGDAQRETSDADTRKDRGLPPDQQAKLYRELFAEEEAAADSSREELQLAITLIQRAEEDELAPIRDHLYRRASELAEDHRRRREGLEVLLVAHQGLHAGADYDRALIEERIEIIEDLLRKVRGPEQADYLAQLQTLIGEMAVNALAAKDYEQAEDDYGDLARLLAKTGDREGAYQLKGLIRAIDDAADRAEDIADLRDEVATDPDSALEVGRYDLAQGAYQAALDSLAMADEEAAGHLVAAAKVAMRMAEKDDLGIDELKILADALEAERRSEAPIRRRLVGLAIELRDRLAADADQITTLRIQAMGESWDALAEELGPDPLQAVSMAGGVSESQLLRMGWVAIFDHRTFPGSKGPVETDDVTMRVRPDGILELTVGPDQLSGPGNIHDLTDHRQSMIRFRITEMEGNVHFGFSAKSTDARDAYRLHCKGRAELRGTTSFQSEFGSLPLAPAGEWNDLVWTFNGKQIQAELNGEAFEAHTMDEPATRLGLWIKTREGDRMTMEIQSILYRD